MKLKTSKDIFIVMDADTILQLTPVALYWDSSGNLEKTIIVLPEATTNKLTWDTSFRIGQRAGEVDLTYENQGLHHVCKSLKKALRWQRKLKQLRESETPEIQYLIESLESIVLENLPDGIHLPEVSTENETVDSPVGHPEGV